MRVLPSDLVMPKSDLNAFTLAAAVAAVSVARLVADSGWTTIIAGVLLTLVLLAFSTGGDRSFFQSAAYGGVVGYCLTVAILGGIQFSHSQIDPEWQFGLVVVLGAIFMLLDRMVAGSSASGALLTGQPLPVPVPAAPPRPYTPPPPPPLTAPVAPQPVVRQPLEFTPPPPSFEQPVPAPPPVIPTPPPPPPPNAVALPPNVGKPATIYVNATETGITFLRPVQAEHLGRDFYRIVENPNPGEQWDFTTGQIVRCQKRNLTSGKALVAFEEAPRADKRP